MVNEPEASDRNTITGMPSTVRLLAGAQMAIGFCFGSAFLYTTIAHRLEGTEPRSLFHDVLGLGIGIYLFAWLVAGAGIVARRAWAYWLDGILIAIAFFSGLPAVVAWLSGRAPEEVRGEPNLQSFAEAVASAAPVLFIVWSLDDVQAWCRTRISRKGKLTLVAALVIGILLLLAARLLMPPRFH